MTCGLEGLLDAGAALQFGGDADLAVVLLFHEVHADLAGHHGQEGDDEECEGDEEGDAFVVQAPAQEVGIGAVDGIEGTDDGAVVEAALMFALVGLLVLFLEEEGTLAEHLGREHGDEGDGSGGGDADDDGDDPAHLLHEDAHHAGQHGEWHEDGYEDQGGGNDGGPHLVGGADGCFARVFAAVDVFGDVFEYHDGVVDHHADGHGERGQGDDVQRGVGDEKVDERGDEGDGDGECDDDGGAPVAKEDEHDENHEEKCVEDTLG